jgi:hypothetical protein
VLPSVFEVVMLLSSKRSSSSWDARCYWNAPSTSSMDYLD